MTTTALFRSFCLHKSSLVQIVGCNLRLRARSEGVQVSARAYIRENFFKLGFNFCSIFCNIWIYKAYVNLFRLLKLFSWAPWFWVERRHPFVGQSAELEESGGRRFESHLGAEILSRPSHPSTQSEHCQETQESVIERDEYNFFLSQSMYVKLNHFKNILCVRTLTITLIQQAPNTHEVIFQ